MTMFCYINQNLETIKKEIKIGLISCTVLKHVSVYSRYDYYRKLGNNVSKSVMFAGLDFGVAESWVYCVIKKMEKEI